MILERISMASVVEVEELSETDRGSAGFGSTGVTTAVDDNAAHVPNVAIAEGESLRSD